MAERRSILANVLALASGQAAAFALGLLMHAILARALGPTDYGTLGFAVAVLSYFGIVGSLGIDAWGMRAIAAHPGAARRIVRATLSLRLILSGLAFSILVALVSLWNRPALVGWVVLVQGAGLFTMALTLDYAFQGMERMAPAARRQVLASFLALIGVAAALALGTSVVMAATVIQAAALVAALVMIWEFRRLALPVGDDTPPPAWPRILRASAPLAITQVVTTLYISIDVVMLEFLRPEAEVGYYVAAVRIMTIGMIGAGVLRAAFVPVLSRIMGQPGARAEAAAHYARAVLAIGGLLAAGGFVTAPETLTIVFGAEFTAASPVLRVLMANLLVASLVEVYQTQLFAWHLQKQQMVIMLAGALINIGLNALLIPTWGMAAAACNTLASTIAVMALAGHSLARHGYELHIGTALRVGVPAVLLGAVGLFVAETMDLPLAGAPLRFVAIGGLAVLLYAAFVRVTGAVHPLETWRFLAQKAGD